MTHLSLPPALAKRVRDRFDHLRLFFCSFVNILLQHCC